MKNIFKTLSRKENEQLSFIDYASYLVMYFTISFTESTRDINIMRFIIVNGLLMRLHSKPLAAS